MVARPWGSFSRSVRSVGLSTPPLPLAVPAAPRPAAPPRPWRLLVAACVALAALSLLGPDQPTYDPTAWLIWGREIVHWSLDTNAGPSWKPLPVVFTTVFSLFGDHAAPLLWLVVARAGGLLALAFAYRLAARVAGPAAGVLAAVALVLQDQFVSLFARGDSEGLLVALVLWAVERHLDGRRRDAFLLGVAAALLRPEVWPFLALYGLWMVAVDWRGAPPWRTMALVGGCGVLVAVLWFVPEYLGSGNLLRAASRAREPVPDSPAQAAVPFAAVFTNSASALCWPVYAGAVLAVLGAVGPLRGRRGSGIVLAVAAMSTVLMLIVAVLAQIGFTGNLRYVMLPAAMVCVLGGVGWAWLVAAFAERRGVRWAAAAGVVALGASAAFLVSSTSRIGDQWRQVRLESRLYAQVPDLVSRAGGEAAVKRCGHLYTGPFQTQIVAWYLHVHEEQVGLHPDGAPAAVLAPRYLALARDGRFPLRAQTRGWVLRAACGPAGG